MEQIIVDISNIEDLIRAKISIDAENEKLNGERSELADFMKEYCMLDKVLVKDGKYMPFKYITTSTTGYTFIADINDKDNIVKYLESISYDFDSIHEVPMTELLQDENYLDTHTLILYNSKYYKL